MATTHLANIHTHWHSMFCDTAVSSRYQILETLTFHVLLVIMALTFKVMSLACQPAAVWLKPQHLPEC